MLSFLFSAFDLTLNPSPEERDFLAPFSSGEGLGMRS